MENPVSRHSSHCATQGIHAIAVGKNVNCQAQKESDCQQTVDAYCHRKLEDYVDEQNRHSHTEKAYIVEHHGLDKHQNHGDDCKFDCGLVHCGNY